MTEAERAAALADNIERYECIDLDMLMDEQDVLLIVAALRRLAEQSFPSPATAGLREVVYDAVRPAVLRARREFRTLAGNEAADLVAAAALSAIQRDNVILPREPTVSFNDLRTANIDRQAIWCPEQVPDMSFRAVELGGEVGEALNIVKKLERERLGWRGSRASVDDLAQELADVVICIDLLAMSVAIDLGAAVVAKFNATSEKVGLPTKIRAALAAKEPTR